MAIMASSILTHLTYVHCAVYPVIAVAALVSFDIYNKRLLYYCRCCH